MLKVLKFGGSSMADAGQYRKVKEIILSDWEQRTLELPYTPAADVSYFSGATTDPWAGLEEIYKK